MSHYDLLGVATDAGEDEVRRAYLARARVHHPDAGGDAGAMTALNQAWEVLSDPRRRHQYDRSLGLAPAAGGGAPDADPDGQADLDVDLLDDRPISPARLPGSLPLLPPAIFVAAIAVGCIALVLDAPAVLGVAVLLFMLSCVAVAAVALLTLRGAAKDPHR